MLKKLLKYDFKSLNKKLIGLYLLTILFAVFTKCLNLISKKISIVGVVSSLAEVLFIIMLLSVFIYTFIVIIKRYYTNIFKDEGYLTNTLPVKKSEIVLAKYLSSLSYIILSILVIIISVLIRYYSKGLIEGLNNIINGFAYELNISAALLVISLIIVYIASFSNYILFIFTSITLGQTKNNNKIRNSVIYGIIIYMLMQVISMIAMIINIAIIGDFEEFINNADAFNLQFMSIIIIELVLIIVYQIIYFKIINKTLNKNLNIE